MTFANPSFLWALLAVPIPVLVHLFFRRRKATIAFSTLQFFVHRKRDLAYRRRIRQRLLLLLRTLALSCLALALAKPLLQKTRGAFASRTNVVLVIDDTLSMNRKLGSGTTALAFAIQKADEILDTLAEGDGASLVFLSGRPGVALTRKRQQVRQRLEEAQITGATGSYAAALEQASRFLSAEDTLNREVFILSDFQANQLPSRPLNADGLNNARLYLLPISGRPENLAVDGVALSSRPLIAHRTITLPYSIRNLGETDAETEISLVIGQTTVTTETRSVLAGKTVKGSFDYVPPQAGVLNGFVQITDRNLECDNRFYFVLNVNENTRVLLLESDVTSRTRPFHFLKRAVDPVDGQALNGIQTETAFVQTLSAKDLERVHVVVLATPHPLSSQCAPLLERHTRNGGTLLVFSGPATTPPPLSTFQGAHVQNMFGGSPQQDLTGLSLKGPLAGLNDLLQMNLIRWRPLSPLSLAPSAKILAESQGYPLIAEEQVGAGKFIACAFSPHRDAGNWPELKSFPITLIHLLTYASHDPQQNVRGLCGHPLRLTAHSADDKLIALSHSDGVHLSVPVTAGEALLAETWEPGIVTAERALPRCTAINPVPAESDLRTTDPNGLATRLVTGKATLLKTGASLETQIRSTRQGTDLSGLFLLLMLLFLLSELVVASPARQASADRHPRRQP